MSARLIRVIASALVGTVAVATVQAAEEIPPVGDFKEVYHEAAVISGGVIVGVMRSGPPSDVSPFLSAKLPTDWADVEICARVVSSDGRYQAERTYLVPSGWRDNVALMPYQTRFPDKLARYDSEHIAVAVSQGNCGARKARPCLTVWTRLMSGFVYPLILSGRNTPRTTVSTATSGRFPRIRRIHMSPYDKTNCIL